MVNLALLSGPAAGASRRRPGGTTQLRRTYDAYVTVTYETVSCTIPCERFRLVADRGALVNRMCPSQITRRAALRSPPSRAVACQSGAVRAWAQITSSPVELRLDAIPGRLAWQDWGFWCPQPRFESSPGSSTLVRDVTVTMGQTAEARPWLPRGPSLRSSGTGQRSVARRCASTRGSRCRRSCARFADCAV